MILANVMNQLGLVLIWCNYYKDEDWAWFWGPEPPQRKKPPGFRPPKPPKLRKITISESKALGAL